MPNNKVTQRPSHKQTIFLGIQGIEENKKLLAVVGEAFPEHSIHLMDKEGFNNAVEAAIKKVVKWQENKSILAFTSKPEHIQQAILTSLKLKQAVGDDWFTLSNLVEKTNFSYSQARDVLELQYSFGFLAMDTSENITKYKSISTQEERIAYVNNLIESMDSEVNELKQVMEMMKKEGEPAAIVEEAKVD